MTQKILPPGRTGIRVLAADLRAQLPPNFIWDFRQTLLNHDDCPNLFEETYHRSCGTAGCAMGYAQVLYSNITEFNLVEEHLDLEVEITDENDPNYGQTEADLLFYASEKYYPGCTYSDITPQMVATALERYLEETPDQD